ncbi:MAG TPA: hypothetical protein VK895_00980 [Jiangellaceae bacterium]|nr:hypothetical protein [Jiangellaceae bacterium]
MDMSGESIEDVLADIGIDEEIPEGATVRSYEDDVYVGQEFVLNGVDIAEFTDEEGVVHHPRRRGRTYDVSGAMDMTDIGAEAAGLGDFDISVSITFPGEVTDHNGTLDGRTVTWTPVLGETNEIRATARDGSGSDVPTWLLIAIAVAVAAVLAGLAYFLTRRNRATPETPGVANEGPPAGTWAPESPASAGDTRPIGVPAPPDETPPLGYPASAGGTAPVVSPASAADTRPIDYSAVQATVKPGQVNQARQMRHPARTGPPAPDRPGHASMPRDRIPLYG